jgi:outer membrane protein
MKKIALLAVSLALLTSQSVQADMLGATVGAEYWDAEAKASLADAGSTISQLKFTDKRQPNFYARFEHPIPLIPNVAVRQQSLDFSGSTVLNADLRLNGTLFNSGTTIGNDVDFSFRDATAYYELLDNELVSVDAGVTARFINADAKLSTASVSTSKSVSFALPMLYARTEIGVLGTGMSVFAEGNYVSYSDNSLYDVQAGVGFELIDIPFFELLLKVGVKATQLELDDQDDIDADVNISGAFAAVEARF